MASSNNSSTTNNQPQSNNGVPSSSTFSFKAPYPVSSVTSATVTALKQRRVSLASPSSPRVVQPWSFRDEMGLDLQNTEAASSSAVSDNDRVVPEKKGKMRKIDTTKSGDESPPNLQEKKQRKKWSHEETMMLVNGCQIHGVGNWKTILQDPDLKFHDRTAVDLKDRFRTYFPDAYKKHYPNARTHLSSKIRSTFPDGTSLFEKTRSKRRRPFTEAEDRALKAGYEKHGTTWATIVKDPIFQEQNRRSTDLRDRFRNAFPHLYQAAGYKPRTAAKKKMEGPIRAADDQLASMSTAGPVRSRRRAQSSGGLLRGGTKSVPQSTACSEDEYSSGGEEEDENSLFKKPPTPIFVDNMSPFRFMSKKASPPSNSDASTSTSARTSSASTPAPTPTVEASYMEADDEMELITVETDPLNIPDFMPNDTHSDMETWSSGINTPTHSSTAAWSTAAASPTLSHVSDFLMNAGASTSANTSNASSPFIQRRNDVLGNNLIGKSAWGQDWFSLNPKLDAASSASSTSSSSFIDASFSPSSPFSFHPHLNHGVLDRYDLFPTSMPNHISSDAGLGDSHHTFSNSHDDRNGMGMGDGSANGVGNGGSSSGGTGFKGYHSQIAGDLISGVGARGFYNQHQQPFSNSNSMPLSFANMNIYQPPFGLGLNGFGISGTSGTGGANEILGLGLEGIPEDDNAGIHPMQLHSHNNTSSFSSIDELGLTGISLNDRPEQIDDAMEDVIDMEYANRLESPGKSTQQQQHHQSQEQHQHRNENSDQRSNDGHDSSHSHSHLSDPFDLDDLVDMSNELHATPPATPVLTQPRPMRRSSGGSMLRDFDTPGGFGSGGGHHARSISVPPSEARNGGAGGSGSNGGMGGVPMSMDDVGLHMHSYSYSQTHAYGQGHGHSHTNSQPEMNPGKGLQALFGMPLPSSATGGRASGRQLGRNANSEPMRLSTSTGSMAPPMSPPLQQQQYRQQHHQQRQQDVQPATLFPAHLMLSSSSPSSASGSSQPPTPNNNHVNSHGSHTTNTINDPWRLTSSSATWMNPNTISSSDLYNVPYLDLHYATYGSMSTMSSHNASGSGLSLGNLDATLDDIDHSQSTEATRQGQALDLAQSAVLASSSGLGLGTGFSSFGLGLNLGFGSSNSNPNSKSRDADATTPLSSPSPMGTIRRHHKLGVKPASAGPGSSVSPPSDSFASVAAVLAAAAAIGGGDSGNANGSCVDDSAFRGTIRQSHIKSSGGGSGLGRSMSHHRGQSAVCPQDLMLKNDNKRKRASWDGGLV